jgi:Protein of unknown function (DUF3429)
MQCPVPQQRSSSITNSLSMTQISESKRSSGSIIPPIVRWLGYGGLLPFLVLAGVVWVDKSYNSLWREALFSYGAVILSFVGALHWGFAMSLPGMTAQQRTGSFVWSVVPALMGWVALLLTPKYAGALLVIGFLIHFWQDWRLVTTVNLPAWYLPMRLRLTLIACFSLIFGAF